MFEHYIPQNFNNNSQIKKSKPKNMKYLVKIRKPLPFSWREVEVMKKNECFLECHDEFERELKRQDNEQLKMFEGKPKRFKN